MAAELDGRIELVAGAFSQSAERSRKAGESFKIDPGRAYASYSEMFAAERKRPDAIDFVTIVTPNSLHLPVAVAALEASFAVVSDKPATAKYDEVLALEVAVAKSSLPYALTHTYAGYALVREARSICTSGQLGRIRKVAVEYLQGWLSRSLEGTGNKQAEWRSDPALNGPGGCIGDIGVHAFHLLEYVTGLRVTSLNAALRTVVDGRRLDDDCNAMLRLENGATGVLMASQVAAGEGNGLSEDARVVTRLPGGHPEGFIEAFAVLYREFADGLIAWRRGEANPLPATLPGIVAGVRGMRFIERAIQSSKDERWVEF
jgi:predicted dehydrogenase